MVTVTVFDSGEVFQPLVRFTVRDAFPEVAPALPSHPFRPIGIRRGNVFQRFSQPLLPSRVVAGGPHIAAGSKRGARTLGNAAGDAGAFHGEIVAENDALEAE